MKSADYCSIAHTLDIIHPPVYRLRLGFHRQQQRVKVLQNRRCTNTYSSQGPAEQKIKNQRYQIGKYTSSPSPSCCCCCCWCIFYCYYLFVSCYLAKNRHRISFETNCCLLSVLLFLPSSPFFLLQRIKRSAYRYFLTRKRRREGQSGWREEEEEEIKAIKKLLQHGTNCCYWK